ncbi:MAG: Uma2 family endonuclease [Acidobacteria bacterium]|nr:Uma2 family endonuclease [Acidobacteriota bacterium]
MAEALMRYQGVSIPPTQDELPYSDGEPMESNYHVLQMYLLIETLKLHWKHRKDVFIGGNMFVYFSPTQSLTHDYRGPDFFIVKGVEHRERDSWLVWEEDGKTPDVVIELLSASTAKKDREEKKLIYQNNLRVPEYFLFDPRKGDFEGYALNGGIYEPLHPDERGRLISQQCQLALTRWKGVYSEEYSQWLRWETLSGEPLPTAEETAGFVKERNVELEAKVELEKERTAELEALLAQYREKFGALPE